MSVTVNDTRRPALAPVGGVSVLLRAPDGRYVVHPATRAADGQWVAMTDDIDTAGAWHVAVTVQRPGLPPVTDTHAWGVGGGPAPTVSAAPLRPLTTTLAVLLGAAVSIAGGVWWMRRRRNGERAAAISTDSADLAVAAAERQVTEPSALVR